MSADVPEDVAAAVAARGHLELAVDATAGWLRVEVVSVWPDVEPRLRGPHRHTLASCAAREPPLVWASVRGYLAGLDALRPSPTTEDVARLRERLDAALALVLRREHAASCSVARHADCHEVWPAGGDDEDTCRAAACDCGHAALVALLRVTP